MPDHAKQVGVLCQRVIDLLGLSMTEGQSILLGESNIAHMVSRHPADFALYAADSGRAGLCGPECKGRLH